MIDVVFGVVDYIEPVNVGNPGEFTILQLARMIIDLTGSESKIVYRELPQDDPLQRRPDITLARQELGWDPVISLEKGLLKTIDYFRGVL